jgi:hypothetical protein
LQAARESLRGELEVAASAFASARADTVTAQEMLEATNAAAAESLADSEVLRASLQSAQVRHSFVFVFALLFPRFHRHGVARLLCVASSDADTPPTPSLAAWCKQANADALAAALPCRWCSYQPFR